VVWAKNGTVRACQPGKLQVGAGHVAFYAGPSSADKVLVVSGNQREQGHHAVTRVNEPVAFGQNRLLTVRTASYL
jgi:hypothetical protein